MLYAGCVNLKNLPNLNFNKMMMMMMISLIVLFKYFWSLIQLLQNKCLVMSKEIDGH